MTEMACEGKDDWLSSAFLTTLRRRTTALLPSGIPYSNTAAVVSTLNDRPRSGTNDCRLTGSLGLLTPPAVVTTTKQHRRKLPNLHIAAMGSTQRPIEVGDRHTADSLAHSDSSTHLLQCPHIAISPLGPWSQFVRSSFLLLSGGELCRVNPR